MSRNVVSCMRCTGHGSDFELIPTVQMESQYSVGWPTCHKFPRFLIISEKSRPEVRSRWRRSPKKLPFRKKDPYGQIFKTFFPQDSCGHRTTSCVQISWNLADRRSAKSCVTYRTKKFKSLSRCRFCADHAQNLSGRVPDNIGSTPNFIRIRSRSYSRTREQRWSAPQSVSNRPYSAKLLRRGLRRVGQNITRPKHNSLPRASLWLVKEWSMFESSGWM